MDGFNYCRRIKHVCLECLKAVCLSSCLSNIAMLWTSQDCLYLPQTWGLSSHLNPGGRQASSQPYAGEMHTLLWAQRCSKSTSFPAMNSRSLMDQPHGSFRKTESHLEVNFTGLELGQKVASILSHASGQVSPAQKKEAFWDMLSKGLGTVQKSWWLRISVWKALPFPVVRAKIQYSQFLGLLPKVLKIQHRSARGTRKLYLE